MNAIVFEYRRQWSNNVHDVKEILLKFKEDPIRRFSRTLKHRSLHRSGTGDTDGDGVVDTTADVLSFTCGCSTTPPPARTPEPLISNSSRVSTGGDAGACSDGDSFSILSDTLPDIEGCYLDTKKVNNGHPVYTVSGATDLGQIWVVAVELELDETSSIVSGNIHVALSYGMVTE